MSKKVFRLQTNFHPNASYHQAEEVRAWLVSIMEQVARQQPSPSNNENNGSLNGPMIDVIVEVL